VGIMTGGDGGSGPAQAGRGGLGATRVYVVDSATQYDQVGVADNNVAGGRLLTKSYLLQPNNTFFVSFIYNVGKNGVPFYQIGKDWSVSGNGVISLRYRWTFQRNGYVNEPAYNFSFNRDLDWRNASWFPMIGVKRAVAILRMGILALIRGLQKQI
jgi:hypothetical protein